MKGSFKKRAIITYRSLIIIKTPTFMKINFVKTEPASNRFFMSVKILAIISVFFSPVYDKNNAK